jgi:hypothetical protein
LIDRVRAPPDKHFSLYRDADGNMLMGGNTYRPLAQADVPVTQYRQIPVYETKTRALIDTEQKKSRLSVADHLLRDPHRAEARCHAADILVGERLDDEHGGCPHTPGCSR